MLTGSALITAASIPYFDFETLPPFVIEKLPVRFETLWLTSLRIHVASVSLAFPLCLMLMMRWLQRRPMWHRRLGRVAGVLTLLAVVPSGTVLAFDAKGGAAVTAGFLLSGGIVYGCMAAGILAARNRNLTVHSRAMRHVVGQMSVAVVSRAMIIGLDMAGMDPDLAYVFALWVPVLGSVAAVEHAFIRHALRTFNPVSFIERIRRESSPLSPIHVRAVARPLARFGR
jgi:hypothetical protein